MPEIPVNNDKNTSLLENPKKLWGIILAISIPLVVYMLYFQIKSHSQSVDKLDSKEKLEKVVSFRPFASPAASDAQNPAMSQPLDELTAKLAMKLENNPNDVPGWTLLGRSYMVTGHPDKAITAYKKAIALSPNDIELQISLGEALVTASNGKVTPEAKKIFLAAEKMQVDHPGVKFNLALSDFQAGEVQKAYDVWLKLAQGAPPSASWLKDVRVKINLAAKQLGIDPPPLSRLPQSSTPQKWELPSALTMNDVQGGDGTTAEERDDFIRGMVQRLADRLEKQPDDLQGWLRLAQSYNVLGEKAKALSSYREAMKLAPDDEKIQQLYQNAKMANN
jgi:cytochrome c-type biogenesis protein CcmH